MNTNEIQDKLSKNTMNGQEHNTSSFITSGIARMDDANLKAMEVWTKQGPEKAVEFMFTHPNEKNGESRQMSYSEMRSMYG